MYEIIDTKRSHRRDQFLAGLPLTLDFENASFVSAIIHATHIAERTHYSGQLNPDTWLGRSSAFAGAIPSLC